MKTGAIIMRLAAVLIGISAPAIAAVVGGADASLTMIYVFLSFCALIVIGQLIPLISSFVSAEKTARLPEKEGSVPDESCGGRT